MSKRWTEEELDFLNDTAGLLNYKEIGKKLGRSAISVKRKRYLAKLPKFNENIYSIGLVAKELGRSKSGLKYYYHLGLLKGRKATWSNGFLNPPVILLEEDIIKFLKLKYYIFDPSKIPNLYFKNIIKEAYNNLPSSNGRT